MPTNDFLPFATAGGAGVLTQSEYAALAARLSGFLDGIAEPTEVNKVWRQASVMAAMLGQFIGDYGNLDALDDGDVADLVRDFARSIQRGTFAYVVATGTANAWTVAPTPALAAYAAGRVLNIIAPATNTSTTVNANISTLGNRRIKKANGADPAVGDLVSGQIYATIDDGTNIRVLSLLPSDALATVNANKTTVVYGAGSFSWVCPPGITRVTARGRGAAGGGGGATGASFGAGGGSGGSFFAGTYTVVPGTSYSINVGTGGAGGLAAGSNGSDGGATSFDSFASAPGGLGGPVANAGSSVGAAAPSNATGGQINWPGVAGGNGLAPGGAGQGGTGGGSYGQAAANINPISSGAGIAGTLPGVGGNGGGGAGFAGGAGGNGELILEF